MVQVMMVQVTMVKVMMVPVMMVPVMMAPVMMVWVMMVWVMMLPVMMVQVTIVQSMIMNRVTMKTESIQREALVSAISGSHFLALASRTILADDCWVTCYNNFACIHPCTSWCPYYCMQTMTQLNKILPAEEWTMSYHGMLPFHCACQAEAPQSVLQ